MSSESLRWRHEPQLPGLPRLLWRWLFTFYMYAGRYASSIPLNRHRDIDFMTLAAVRAQPWRWVNFRPIFVDLSAALASLGWVRGDRHFQWRESTSWSMRYTLRKWCQICYALEGVVRWKGQSEASSLNLYIHSKHVGVSLTSIETPGSLTWQKFGHGDSAQIQLLGRAVEMEKTQGETWKGFMGHKRYLQAVA